MPEARTNQEGRWRFPLLLLVMAAHAWLGWKLAHYRPVGAPLERFLRRDSTAPEILMVLDFPSPPPAIPAAGRAARAAQAHRRERKRAPGPKGAQASAARAGDIGQAGTAPIALDLSLPTPAQPSFQKQDPLQVRQGLEFQSTRFDHAWISEGDLTHVMARRSQVASVILGALGALRKPCTERERKAYDRDCVPDQYVGEGALDALPAAR